MTHRVIQGRGFDRGGFLTLVIDDREYSAQSIMTPTEVDELRSEIRGLRATIRAALVNDPDVVHAMEGGGMEDICKSLAITMAKTRAARDEAQRRLRQIAADEAAKKDAGE